MKRQGRRRPQNKFQLSNSRERAEFLTRHSLRASLGNRDPRLIAIPLSVPSPNGLRGISIIANFTDRKFELGILKAFVLCLPAHPAFAPPNNAYTFIPNITHDAGHASHKPPLSRLP